MEKKNTILLTVIAVATLLVAVVGATFAYFTATTGNSGDPSSTGEVQTAKVASVTLKTAAAGTSNTTIYPGTKNYAGMTVVAEKTGDNAAADTRDYNVTYTLKGEVKLSEAFTAGKVTYSVYRTESPVSNPVTCQEVTSTGAKYSQTCTLAEELESATKIVDNQEVSGTGATISVADQVRSTAGGTYYYYLVVSYENLESDQNADQGKTITASLTTPDITGTEEAE